MDFISYIPMLFAMGMSEDRLHWISTPAHGFYLNSVIFEALEQPNKSNLSCRTWVQKEF